MSDQQQEPSERPEDQDGTAVSEGGSGALDPGTALGGADSVPDTPDVNTEISDAVDINESSEHGEAPSSVDPDEPD
ncbi:hypothetical protein [Ornithinimicrobium avium]|uniref:Uncharacterized protein n=1 Tax=Ornithinimicrobium avium TaxID=2283195 RepID=A0A345NQW0_9MICO|nr:hypothetical protein [Ornithinimicrobium avium]AXH97418.1 hypothetical protein DV701_16040 [Ornithinimicrobium avium]